MRLPRIRDPKLRAHCARNPSAHGSDIHRTRYGRAQKRFISDWQSMNVTLRSSQARGDWSFRTPKNFQAVNSLTRKFAERFKVQVLRLSNNHNHLHYHLRFPSKKAYVKFIRALTAALAIAITGVTRWTKALAKKFWDRRPYTRVIETLHQYATYENYLDLNDLEAEGFPRPVARWMLKMRDWAKWGGKGPPPGRWGPEGPPAG